MLPNFGFFLLLWLILLIAWVTTMLWLWLGSFLGVKLKIRRKTKADRVAYVDSMLASMLAEIAECEREVGSRHATAALSEDEVRQALLLVLKRGEIALYQEKPLVAAKRIASELGVYCLEPHAEIATERSVR